MSVGENVGLMAMVGGSGVFVGTKPKGVSVYVAVAVGKGVMLGKNVIVMDGVSVGIKRVADGSAVGTEAVSVPARCVPARLGDAAGGAVAGAGRVVIQADAASKTATAIKNVRFVLFMAQPYDQQGTWTFCWTINE
jgi:hypothetical protein